MSHRGDVLHMGGSLGEMTNGTSYREVRGWWDDYHLVEFYFVTKCHSDYMEKILTHLSKGPAPDLVVMNSCVWDITR